MTAKFWRAFLIALLLVPASVGAQDDPPEKDSPPEQNSECISFFSGKRFSLRHPIQSFLENLPALASRVKPIYIDPKFEVRVISARTSKNAFSPAKLKDKTVQDVTELLTAYDKMGFSPKTYLEFFVEAHPGAIGLWAVNYATRTVWLESVPAPFVGPPGASVTIPDITGRRKMIRGRLMPGFDGFQSLMVFPAMSTTYHSIQHKFALAHEMAHTTENMTSLLDLMWTEARADFLAYLATGITEIVFPETVYAAEYAEDGSVRNRPIQFMRSMSDPTIRSAEMAIPNLGAYHVNSQIISSSLYEISQKVGKAAAIDLVQWMDHQDRGRLVNLETKEFMLEASEKSTPGNVAVLRAGIESRLKEIGQLFRQWLSQSQLTPEERQTALSILESRKI